MKNKFYWYRPEVFQKYRVYSIVDLFYRAFTIFILFLRSTSVLSFINGGTLSEY